MPDLPATTIITEVIEKYADDLIALRRDLHAHPELSWGEARTSECVVSALDGSGWSVNRLDGGGVTADIGSGDRLIALRADLDALPLDDLIADPWKSTVPGVAHACGHDVHTAGLVGAGLALAEVSARGLLPGRVRLLFQPAEEVMPGGALHLLAAGALRGVDHVFGLHCDPSLDVGRIGLREGPLTGAADSLTVRVVGKGGHTSRPHLTEDLTFALGKLITELPAILSRRLDPRAGVSVVWGMVRAGSAPNVIPHAGIVAGTVRMLDAVAWADAEHLIRQLVTTIVAPYGVSAEVSYQRGVPPVVNHPVSTAIFGEAVERVLGPHGHVTTTQSLGGEDFGWYLDTVSGAMARLGTRTSGGPTYDLHQGNLRIDEAATPIAARVLAEAALTALAV
ncbi:MAG: amidohydrolase [Nocardioides sp.]|nr:amidohydrolase [Nocardioides sp.]